MKGGREAWVYIVVIGLMIGIARDGRRWRGRHRRAASPPVRPLPSCSASGSSSFPRTQLERLYLPLMQALADADNLTAYCRESSTTSSRRPAAARGSAARKNSQAQARPITSDYLRRPRPSATNGSARSTRSTPIAWSRSRPHSSATFATPSTPTIAAWPSSKPRRESRFQKLDEKYRALKEQIVTRYETAWRAMADTLARRDAAAPRPRSRPSGARTASYCPAWDDPVLGDRGRSPRRCRR